MLDQIKTKIADEIDRLVHELNVTLPAAIEKAVELGDLRENADYKAALERQQFVRVRIDHLTKRMSELSKIDVDSVPDDRVGFGSQVQLKNLDTGDEITYTLVTGDFMDIEAGHVSMDSPIGQALLGRSEGEEVAVRLPRGETRFRVNNLVTLPRMVD